MEPMETAIHTNRKGRPKLPPGEAKSAQVVVRTTPAKLARAKEQAKAAGLPFNQWMERRMCDEQTA